MTILDNGTLFDLINLCKIPVLCELEVTARGLYRLEALRAYKSLNEVNAGFVVVDIVVEVVVVVVVLVVVVLVLVIVLVVAVVVDDATVVIDGVVVVVVVVVDIVVIMVLVVVLVVWITGGEVTKSSRSS
jgi:hypothetical protein